MFRQNRDTWQIWALIPVIIISILGNIVLSDFYIGLTQFRRPYVPIFRSFSNKNAGFKGTNGRQKTYGIFHVYCIFYSGFRCQTTVIFGITKDGSPVLNY